MKIVIRNIYYKDLQIWNSYELKKSKYSLWIVHSAIVISEGSIHVVSWVMVTGDVLEHLLQYRNNPKYLVRKVLQTHQALQNTASDQGLYCLPYIQQCFRCVNSI